MGWVSHIPCWLNAKCSPTDDRTVLRLLQCNGSRISVPAVKSTSTMRTGGQEDSSSERVNFNAVSVDVEAVGVFGREQETPRNGSRFNHGVYYELTSAREASRFAFRTASSDTWTKLRGRESAHNSLHSLPQSEKAREAETTSPRTRSAVQCSPVQCSAVECMNWVRLTGPSIPQAMYVLLTKPDNLANEHVFYATSVPQLLRST